MRRAVVLALVAGTAFGCSERPVTEIVVVSDTDLAVPAQVDAITISIEPPMGLTSVQRGALEGEGAIELPATLGVVHRGGPLGPVRVVASALHDDDVVVVREAVLEFVPDRTVVLVLPLQGICRDVPCPEGETCEAGACRPVQITRDELPPFDGTTPRLEGGMPCTPELCNDFDDDCDGRIDETFDLRTSVEDCGVCGRVCPPHPNGMPACVEGECTIACGTGFGDCDGDVRNGCEVPLNTLTMCGECGVPCEVDHGTPTCWVGVCEPETCAPGWDDCNGLPEDGCESPLDTPEHCGTCATPCAPAHATPTCTGGACRIAGCEPGWADCDPTADGCERSIATITDCGACDVSCGAIANGTPGCVEGRCGVGACSAGWADCNGDPADGCETSLETLSDCGGCGVACALPRATEACGAAGCAIVACAPGWGDCNGSPSDGCETSLETATDCGECRAACSAATPLCGATSTGGRACQSSCETGQMMCGASCVDVSSSLAHCGGCDQACAPANAVGACEAGACTIVACDPGFGDCDGLVSTGCETRLDTLTDCGACDVACSLPGASERCEGGRCQIGSCDPARANCDGSPQNGCETAIDTVTHCGSCTTACELPDAIEACVAGACAIAACAPGYEDCDGLAANGCETMLGTVADCGGCGDMCDLAHASEACVGGACAIAQCDAEYDDCNGVVSDGCETSLRTTTSCGGCGDACPTLLHASASCATGACELDRCDPLWGDCDGRDSTGCEQSLEDLDHCGGCGVECVVNNGGGAVATCAGGTCALECPRSDRLDCNGRLNDGCEARVLGDTRNCGACGNACSPGQSCDDGVCTD